MKNLCICQYGHSRSVALARLLHALNYPAVAAGWLTSGDAINILSEWADRIFILQDSFIASVPVEQRHKVVVFDVGPDIWSNPYHPELAAKLKQMYIDKYGTGK